METVKTTHTPVPWGIGTGGFHAYYVNSQIEAGEDIDDPQHDSIVFDTRPSDAAFSGIDEDTMRANAEFIVRTCNAHAEILAALEAVTRYADRERERSGKFSTADPETYAVLVAVEGAIRKATSH